MAITLSPETQALVEKHMAQAGFSSADDAVRAAIAQWGQREIGNSSDLEALYPGYRANIDQALAESAAGLSTDGEEFFAELEREERAFEQQQQGRKTA